MELSFGMLLGMSMDWLEIKWNSLESSGVAWNHHRIVFWGATWNVDGSPGLSIECYWNFMSLLAISMGFSLGVLFGMSKDCLDFQFFFPANHGTA